MSDAKVIRGQVRQVVKEILPEIMQQQMYESLKKHTDQELAKIEKFVKETLHKMQDQHKDTMGYLVRQASLPVKKD